MSDYFSIKDDEAWEAALEDAIFKHQAELREQAEDALLELLPDADPDVLFGQDIYGDPLHGAVIGLVDAVQEVIWRASEQRKKALRTAVETRMRIANEFWADRIQAAIEKKRDDTTLSNASEIAKSVIDDEIENENITNEADLAYLKNTVTETLRKKLGKTPEYKGIK